MRDQNGILSNHFCLIKLFFKKHGTFQAHDICQRIEQRFQCWMKCDFIALITDTIEEALQNEGPHDKTDFDTKTYIFNSLLLNG